MARPNWEWIKVDVLMPEHRKTDDLSDKAFRTLIELWCWCGLQHNDGFVRAAKWKTFGTPAARAALIKAGWVDQAPGGYLMHDYVGPDGHQRSKREIDELSEKRAEAGRKGGRSGSKTQASA